MKRLKKYLVALCIFLFLLSVIIWAFSLRRRNEKEILGDGIYNTAQDVLAAFPDLPEEYENLTFYLNNGISEYMIVKAGDTQVTGLRTDGSETIYYSSGYKYSKDSNGQFVMLGEEADPVSLPASQFVGALLADSTVEYDFYVARGRDLPKWVYPDEHYIRFTRKDFDFLMETIVIDHGQYGEYIRWSIVDDQGQPAMFLFISEEVPTNNTAGYLNGWGDLDSIAGVFEDQP